MKYLIQPRLCKAFSIVATKRSAVAVVLFFSVFVILDPSNSASAQASLGEARSGLNNPAAAAFNPTTGKAYIVDAGVGAVNIIDDATGKTSQVKVGAGPVSIAVDTANGRAFVANADDGTVTVLDGKTDAVLATLNAGDHLYSIAADSAAGKIYVTRTYSDQLMVIDAATDQVSSVKAGSPDLIAVNPSTHSVYLLSYEGGNLKIMKDATGALTSTSAGMHAWGLALDESTGTLYIAKIGDNKLAEFATGSLTPTLIPTGNMPCAVAINPRTHTIYVANYAGNSVTMIDGDTSMPVATVPVGKRPQDIAVDAERNRIYVANTQAGTVSVIDGATRRVVSTSPAGHAPYALALDTRAGKVHVANVGEPSFTTLDMKPLNTR